MLKVKVEPVDPSLRTEVHIEPTEQEEQEENLGSVTIAGYQVYCNEREGQKSQRDEEGQLASTPTEEVVDSNNQVEREGDLGERVEEPLPVEDETSTKDPGPVEEIPSEETEAELNIPQEESEEMEKPHKETGGELEMHHEETEREVEMHHEETEGEVEMHHEEMEGGLQMPQEGTGGEFPVVEVAPIEEVAMIKPNTEHGEEVVLEDDVVVETAMEGEEIVTEEMPEVIVEEGIQEEEVSMSGVMEVPYIPNENAEETVYVFQEGVEYVVEEGTGEEYIMESTAKVEGDDAEHVVAIINEGEEGEQRVLLQRQEDGNHVIVESLPYDTPLLNDYAQFNLPASNRSSPRHVIGGDGIAVQEDIEVSTEDPVETVESEPKPVKKPKRKRSESKSPKEKKAKKPPKKKLKVSSKETVNEPEMPVPIPKKLPKLDIPGPSAPQPLTSPQALRSPPTPKSPKFRSSVSSIQAHHPTLVSLLTPAIQPSQKTPRASKASPNRSKHRNAMLKSSQTVSSNREHGKLPSVSFGNVPSIPVPCAQSSTISMAHNANIPVQKTQVLPPVQTLVKPSLSHPVRPISPISPPAPLDVEYLLHASANFGRFPPLQQVQVPYTSSATLPSPVLNIPTPRSSIVVSSTSPSNLSKSQVPFPNRNTISIPPPVSTDSSFMVQPESLRSPTNRMVNEAIKEMIESKKAGSGGPSVTVPPPLVQVRLPGYIGQAPKVPPSIPTTGIPPQLPHPMFTAAPTEQPLSQRLPVPMQMTMPVRTPQVHMVPSRPPHLPMLKVPSVPQLSQASPSPSSAGYQSLISALQKGRTNPPAVSAASKTVMAGYLQSPMTCPSSVSTAPVVSPRLSSPALSSPRQQVPLVSPGMAPVPLPHELRSPSIEEAKLCISDHEPFPVGGNSSDTLADQYMKHWRPTGKYRCLFCHYSCVTQNFLYRHWLMNHCGLKPYMCGYCGFRSPNKDGITRHQTAKHRGDARQVYIDAEEEELVNQKFNDLFRDQMVSVFRQDSDNSDVVPITAENRRNLTISAVQSESTDSLQQSPAISSMASPTVAIQPPSTVTESNAVHQQIPRNPGNNPNVQPPPPPMPMHQLPPGTEANFIAAAVDRLSQATGAPKELTASLLLAIKREHEKQLAAGVPPDKIHVETSKLILPPFGIPVVKPEPGSGSGPPLGMIPTQMPPAFRPGLTAPQSPLQVALGMPRKPEPAQTSVSGIHIQEVTAPNQPVKKNSAGPIQPSSAVANHPTTAFHLSTAPLPSTARNAPVSHRHVNILSHGRSTSVTAQNGQAPSHVHPSAFPLYAQPNSMIPRLPKGGSTVQYVSTLASQSPGEGSTGQNGDAALRAVPGLGLAAVNKPLTMVSSNSPLVISDVRSLGSPEGQPISHPSPAVNIMNMSRPSLDKQYVGKTTISQNAPAVSSLPRFPGLNVELTGRTSDTAGVVPGNSKASANTPITSKIPFSNESSNTAPSFLPIVNRKSFAVSDTPINMVSSKSEKIVGALPVSLVSDPADHGQTLLATASSSKIVNSVHSISSNYDNHTRGEITDQPAPDTTERPADIQIRTGQDSEAARTTPLSESEPSSNEIEKTTDQSRCS